MRAEDLTRALATARRFSRCFLRDASGEGTTLLAANAESDLRPSYGASSASRHARSGAVDLSAAADFASLRNDVDDVAALSRVVARSCGPETRRVHAGLPALLASA